MKILMIARGIPTKRDPQWGCFELDQARALSNLGHEVIVAGVDGRTRFYWRKIGIEEVSFGDIKAYQLFLLPMAIFFNGKIRLALFGKMMTVLIRKIIAQHGTPDVVYAHYLSMMALLNGFHVAYPNIPIVGIEHWSKLNQETCSKGLKIWGRIAYSTVDRLLAVSMGLKGQIKKQFGRESDVVYDMLGEEFAWANVEKRNRSGEFRFVAVGSLLHGKGFDLLIEAFYVSGLADKGCKLTIIGGGKEYSNLRRQISNNGLTGKVILAGRKNKEEIISILRGSNAFVLASRAETFGVAYIEAMSQGLPVIATKCGGPEEFVNESNGMLVPIDDIHALKEALIQMFCNYEYYDNVAIADECNRRFAPQNIAHQLVGIFGEEIMKKKNETSK